MKNKLKFIVAVMGITVVGFGSIRATYAKEVAVETGRCVSTGLCGYTDAGQNIDGTFKRITQ